MDFECPWRLWLFAPPKQILVPPKKIHNNREKWRHHSVDDDNADADATTADTAIKSYNSFELDNDDKGDQQWASYCGSAHIQQQLSTAGSEMIGIL